ncbi:hypothetical protein GS913_06495 [Rhodococcus hoagii]|nr:hypothetical protein [Prescottella equi]
MTDTTALTVTPELAHRVLDALEQSPHIGPDGSLSALFTVRDAVKAWEAESAREVEVLQLAKRLVQEEFGGYNQWHDLSTSEQERRIQYVKFILAFLAADGRLLPEGGTVAASTRKYPELWMVDAEGGATWYGDREEAAHSIAQSWRDTEPGRTVTVTPPAVPVPGSGPDGTPEKPWPTWQDVPEGVRYQGSTRYGDRSPVFVNREGQRITEWHPGVEFANTHPDWVVDRWAPFVRVDGDQQ